MDLCQCHVTCQTLSLLHTLEGSGNQTNQSLNEHLVTKAIYILRQIGICLHFPQWTDSNIKMETT